MDLAALDFINDVRDVVITNSELTINRRNETVEVIEFQEPPKQLNNIPLDLTGAHSRVVITGGVSGHAVHLHYRDSIRVDCQLYPFGQELAKLKQGELQ